VRSLRQFLRTLWSKDNWLVKWSSMILSDKDIPRGQKHCILRVNTSWRLFGLLLGRNCNRCRWETTAAVHILQSRGMTLICGYSRCSSAAIARVSAALDTLHSAQFAPSLLTISFLLAFTPYIISRYCSTPFDISLYTTAERPLCLLWTAKLLSGASGPYGPSNQNSPLRSL